MSTELLCLFNAELAEQDQSYRIEIPKREIDLGPIEAGEIYRAAVIQRTTTETVEEQPASSKAPPVSEGDVRDLEIESMGDKGDGIARVERGFVVIVSDTKIGDRVRARITDVNDNVAFAKPMTSKSN